MKTVKTVKSVKDNPQFFANVKKVESKVILPGMDFSDHNNHAIVVTRPDGSDQAVNFVSKNYGLLDNREFFPQLESALKTNKFRFEANYKHHEYCKYYADYKIEGRDLSIGSTAFSDKVQPIMKVMRSYSSQIGFRVAFGFYRQICSNGMWGTKWIQQANLKHTAGNLPKMYATITDGVQRFLDEATEQTEVFQVIGDRQVTHWSDRVQEIAAHTDFSAKHVEEVMNRINFEHTNHNLPITDWLIYNGFNYQLNHSQSIASAPEARVKLDREVFNHILNNPFDAKFEPAELVGA